MFYKVVVALTCVQLATYPVQAEAVNQKTVATIARDCLQTVADSLERNNIELVDSEGKTIDVAEALAEKEHVSFLSRHDGLKLNVSHRDLRITLVARDLESDRVLSRRSFLVDPAKNTYEDAQILFKQTSRSMGQDIQKRRAVRTTDFLHRMGSLLESLFGIPSAHAEEVSLAQVVDFLCSVAIVFSVLLILDVLTEKANLFSRTEKRLNVLGGITLATVAGLAKFALSGQLALEGTPRKQGATK